MCARPLGAVDTVRLTETRLSDTADAAVEPETCAATTTRAAKYIFPMRKDNTEVFFQESASQTRTLMIVFAEPHHGLYLDVLSVLKALGVKCWRICGSENDSLRVLMRRIEGELVSVNELGLDFGNCIAFWITDEETGDKLNDDPARLDQITACIRMELERPNPRPSPADADLWHRVTVEANRSNKSSVFSVQTPDRNGLLAEVSAAFVAAGVDVVSAAIQTLSGRVENTFYVRSPNGNPLTFDKIEECNEEIMKALLKAGGHGENETLWYQTRHGSAVFVAEALFIDEVCNKTLQTFAKMETPNFRGRLPDAPYKPVSLQ